VCVLLLFLFCWTNIFRDFALDGTQDFFNQGVVRSICRKTSQRFKGAVVPLPPPPLPAVYGPDGTSKRPTVVTIVDPSARHFDRKFSHSNRFILYSLFALPRPKALIKIFHASHYMKGLHEVVHRDEQAQGVMGLRR
jgi:hypothetical protein